MIDDPTNTPDGSYADDAKAPTPVTPKRGYKTIHVKEYTDPKTKKKVAAHDRIVKIKPSTRDPRTHRRVKFTEIGSKSKRMKRDPISGIKPYDKSLHAQQLHAQLTVPLAYFIAKLQGPFASEYDVLRNCVDAIEEARTFIDRFTNQ